jgi:hypothetical protein
MAGAAIKGVSKLLKRKKTKKKPTPRYRKDPKTGQKFLNRRSTLRGAPVGASSQMKVPVGGYKSGLKEGLTAGAAVGGTGMYLAGRDVASDKAKKTKAKLKKATDKIRDKDKKKKEKRRDNQRQR